MSLSPTAIADALLFSLLEASADALWLAPTEPTEHSVVLDFARGGVTAARIVSPLADAVIARLALIANVDFTAREERFATFSLKSAEARHELSLSVRPVRGHLLAHVRRIMPVIEPRPFVGDPHAAVESFGDYEVLGELGRGAQGMVFRASHRLLQKQVAIKVWSQAATRTELANGALLREARIAASTNHPGVVDVYDILRLPDGRVAIVMELLDGQSLDRKLRESGALEVSEALKIARSIADVLVATHAAGIVHRDLKPANVFLLRDGRLKVLDFGAAVDLDRPDLVPSTLGTPWYMAPEQVQQKAPDERSDIYAVGCILFEMLSGRCPFDGETIDDVMDHQVHAPAPLASSPHTVLPDAIVKLVARALSKNPEQRQQSAFELAVELESAFNGWSRDGFRKWLAP